MVCVCRVVRCSDSVFFWFAHGHPGSGSATFVLSALAIIRRDGWLVLPVGASIVATVSLIFALTPATLWGHGEESSPLFPSSFNDDKEWKQAVEADKQLLRYQAQQRSITQLTLPRAIRPVESISVEDSGIPQDSPLWDRSSLSAFSSAEGSWQKPAKMGRAAVGLHNYVKVTDFERSVSPGAVSSAPRPLPEGHMVAKIELDAVRNLGLMSATGIEPVEVADLEDNVYDPISVKLNLLNNYSLRTGNTFTYTAYYVVPTEGDYRAVLKVGAPVWDKPLSGTYFVELP